MASVAPLSYSGFRVYSECPLKWKFQYIDHLPELPRGYFSFGRSIHSALEAFVAPLAKASGVPSPPVGGRQQRTLHDFGDASEGGTERSSTGLPAPMSIEALLEVYKRVWVNEGYGTPDEERRYYDLGTGILRKFHASYVECPPRPLAVEQELDARLDGVPVHGIVDRIDEGPKGGLEVLDYKTSKELSWQDARSSDQLSLYQFLVEQNYSRPVEALTLYHMRTLSPLRTPPRSATEIHDLSSRMGEVADAIAEEIHDARPGPYCQRCDFRPRCPEWKEVAGEDRARVQALVERYAELKREGDGVRRQLEGVAVELHELSERLGMHRLQGRSATVYRRREVRWVFPPEQVLPVLQGAGLLPRVARVDSDQVSELLHDGGVPADVRRSLKEKGSRQSEWGLRLEGNGGRYSSSASD